MTIGIRIEHRVWDRVAPQEVLQAQAIRRSGRSEQNETRACFDQKRAPQDECAHDGFPNLSTGDDERAQLGRIEGNHFRAVGTGAPANERRPPGELADLAGELTRAMYGHWLDADAVGLAHFDRASQHEIRRCTGLPELEEKLPWAVRSGFAAEAPRQSDLVRGEDRKDLLAATLENRRVHADQLSTGSQMRVDCDQGRVHLRDRSIGVPHRRTRDEN